MGRVVEGVRTMGKNPIPKKIWNYVLVNRLHKVLNEYRHTINTMAVAAKAAGLVPIDSKIEARMKQVERPAADIINSGQRPKRSTVYKSSIPLSGCNEEHTHP